MNAYYHSLSSARKFGGSWRDYFDIHTWIDGSKEFLADFRHRALRHHTEGVFAAERLFGAVLVNSDNKTIPVRLVAEQHIMEDLGRIPSVQDWLLQITPQPWMNRVPVRSTDLLKELEQCQTPSQTEQESEKP